MAHRSHGAQNLRELGCPELAASTGAVAVFAQAYFVGHRRAPYCPPCVLRNHRTIALNKPFDVISRFTLPANAKAGQHTLAEFVDLPNVYPLGRLDRDSEGLLLLSTDGALQHRVLDPAAGHSRTYLAQVEHVPGPGALGRLANGSVTVDGRPCRPAKARLLTVEPELWPRVPPIRHRVAIPTAWIELTLTEGRNRQVRRMTAAVGHPTLRLVRIAIAGITIEGLGPGVWRELTSAELAVLRGHFSG